MSVIVIVLIAFTVVAASAWGIVTYMACKGFSDLGKKFDATVQDIVDELDSPSGPARPPTPLKPPAPKDLNF